MDLLQRLGISQPIFLAPMAGTATPELAAAVSNAGGLGGLGLGSSSLEKAQQAIEQTRKLTDKPFQVNFLCHQPETYNAEQAEAWLAHVRPQFKQYGVEPTMPLQKVYQSFLEYDAYLQLVLDAKPRAISFHFGLPRPEQLAAIKAAGIISMVSVTQLSEALAAEQAGIDVLIAQGVEAGGHRGTFNAKMDAAISTEDLLLLLKQHTNLPIVVAGGIMSGEDIRHYLELGASAAQLGTAFAACPESSASDAYRNALLKGGATQISDDISGRPARGFINAWHKLVTTPERPQHAGYPYSYDLGKQLNSASAKQGDDAFSAFWAGQGVSRIRKLSAAQLMQLLIAEL